MEIKRQRPPARLSGRGWKTAVSIAAALIVLAVAVRLWLGAGAFASVAGCNLVVLGTDINLTGEGRLAREHTRTDTIVVIGIRGSGRQISALSVPRDTLVEIPGHGVTRINAAHAFGGVPLTRATLEKLLGVPVQHYVKTNYEGFVEMIDVLGGITLDVEADLHYEDKSQNLVIDLKRGRQRLNGQQALQYARFRHDAMGDIGRVGRQQKVLKVLARETLSAGNWLKWPRLWRAAWRYTETNLKTSEMIRLAWALRRIKPQDLQTRVLPGRFFGVYWEADPEGVSRAVRECLSSP